MPDNIETENQEEVIDVEVNDTEEIKEEVETKESVISKIAAKVKDFVSGETQEESIDIPDEFTEAGQKLGWTDEDIIKFASDYTDEQLKEMIPSLVVEDSVETEKLADNTPEKDETKVEDSQEDEKIQKLLDRIDALEKAQGKVKEETEQQKQANLTQKASQIFDDKSKEFEIFGKTNELPKFPDGRLVPNSPQLKARNEVWNIAVSLHEGGMDFDKAMSVSLNAFTGKNLVADVKRNIIKDLKKNESKLSGKHTSHESSKTAEYGPDVIREVARRAGRDIN
jgi:hypothetical protein